MSGVNGTLGHFLLQSLSTNDLSERESLTLVSRDPKLVHVTNNINVLILVLHIKLSARLRLAHTAYFSWSLRNYHRTLLASLSSNFSSRTAKGEGETAVLTADLLSAWDELISTRKMTLSSDILRNLIRRTWLISYYMVGL